MKHTLTLAAWNFRLARRSLLALWGIFAAQQLALVVVPLLRYHANFCLSWVLFAYRFGGRAGHPQQPPRPQRVHLGHTARHPGAKVRGQGHHHRRRRGRLCRLAVCVVHR